MRVAVFSDVHGNAVALRAMLADLDRVDALVCLGDVAQGGAQPAESLDLVRELGCRVVLGNADEFLLRVPEESAEPLTERQLAVREWSLAQLSPDQLDFVRSFEPTVETDVGGSRLLCFHGSPRSNEEVLLPSTPHGDVAAALDGADAYAGGHVHLQYLRRVGAAILFNPGSVGLAYDHEQPEDAFFFDPWAQYAVLTADGARLALEFRRVPFDLAEYGAAIRSSGKPFADLDLRGWRLGDA